MRIVVLLLIVANLALFAYTKLDSVSGGEGWRSEQVDPDKLKILTPQQDDDAHDYPASTRTPSSTRLSTTSTGSDRCGAIRCAAPPAM